MCRRRGVSWARGEEEGGKEDGRVDGLGNTVDEMGDWGSSSEDGRIFDVVHPVDSHKKRISQTTMHGVEEWERTAN